MGKITGQEIVFWVAGLLMVVTALGVVLHQNPVRSALLLVVNFCGLAVLYFSLNAQLLGIMQILVYAGAIMVLFLFVVMMLNLGGEQATEDPLVGQRSVATVLGLALLGGLGTAVYWFMENAPAPTDPSAAALAAQVDQTQVIGVSLFTKYLYPFELTSVLLLIGIVGAVVLAKQHLNEELAEADGAEQTGQDD